MMIFAAMNGSLIQRIENEIKSLFLNEGTGHDWFHMDRVRRNALKIAAAEGANLELVELGALLHDIADHKFHQNDLSVGPTKAKELILKCGGDGEIAQKVFDIVNEVSYKGAGIQTPVSSLEAACVQDADRLDAMGAIGIARAFAFGGSRNREIYNPDKLPKLHTSFKEYTTDEGTTINHFYEKLLLLKDRMQTPTGRQMAQEKHKVMHDFLTTFFDEWGEIPPWEKHDS